VDAPGKPTRPSCDRYGEAFVATWAGTINVKTKRAFSRDGRRITAQVNVTAFADEFNLRNSYNLPVAIMRSIA
jgi:hypothetical protein